MEEKYFIITLGENGINIKQIDKKELIDGITPDEDGYTDYGENIKFLDNIPYNEGFLEMDFEDVIIIKGDFVIPKIKKVVTEYEL